MREEVRAEFQNPDAFHRSFPFWGWNGRLEREELVRQVRSMREAGMGGFFIHSRDGLETEYLGTEWMECVRAVTAEAKKLGMYVWLYDEDRWPSGSAGGMVSACGDAYRCKGLTLEVLEAGAYPGLYREEIKGRTEFGDDRNGILAAYAAVAKGDEMRACRRLSMREEEHFVEEECLLAVRLEVSVPSEWFNHEAPPDNLNPDCVRKFIQLTHEKYKAAVGEEFGKTILGIFTDEPSLHDRHVSMGEKRSWIPWTYHYGAYFRELAGYDFLEVMPWLYFHGEKSSRVRRDYWYSIARRYGETYFRLLGEWCGENGLLFTGHFLQEDKMGLAARVNGAVMPNYRYQHVPGIDMLREQTGEYMTVRQCASVARQLGKKQVLTETYGCTGWDFTFEGQKWIGDWQYVLGVNRRCQHLTLYSLRGCRKRDYPPSFNYHNNWWDKNKWVEDYFARVSVVLEQGEAVRDLLLIHPMTTVWGRLGCSPYGNPVRRYERDVPALNEYGFRFNELIEALERAHLSCDLGDEILLGEFGGVRDGMFAVGEARYRAVILPPAVEALLPGTAALLSAYLEQGGYVYAMEPCALAMEPGTPPEEAARLRKLCRHPRWISVKDREALFACLEPYRTIRIENGEGRECRDVLYQLRRGGEGHYLFLVNNSRESAVDVTVSLPFQAVPEELNLLDGSTARAERYQNGRRGLRMPVHLEKTGSAAWYLKPCETCVTHWGEALPYRLNRPNVLPLDYCRYRLDGEAWSGEMEVWQAQRQIRDRLGMIPIEHNGLEQRYRWIGRAHPGDGHRLELAFEFDSDREFVGSALAVERLGEFRTALNGTWLEKSTRQEKGTWFLDRSFETAKLPAIRRGRNRILLSCVYRNDFELENIYLIGAFGVAQDRRLTSLPERLGTGSWTGQGLLHYCGNVTWSLAYKYRPKAPGERVLLCLPEIKAVCGQVRVNGTARPLPWGLAGELRIEQWLRPGKNEIEIEAVGSPRNMMGPFHLEKNPATVNDGSFCPPPGAYRREYLVTPYGLMGEIEIVVIREA